MRVIAAAGRQEAGNAPEDVVGLAIRMLQALPMRFAKRPVSYVRATECALEQASEERIRLRVLETADDLRNRNGFSMIGIVPGTI